MKKSACRRRSSEIIGVEVVSVDTTVTRLPLRCKAADQRGEVAVAGKQHHVIVIWGQFQRIDAELDIHIALHLAPVRPRR